MELEIMESEMSQNQKDKHHITPRTQKNKGHEHQKEIIRIWKDEVENGWQMAVAEIKLNKAHDKQAWRYYNEPITSDN